MNSNLLYNQLLPPNLPLSHHHNLPPQLLQVSQPEESSEPIYQNQGQIFAQQQEETEPIYQNLPLHEKLNMTHGDIEDVIEVYESDTGSVHIDESVDGVALGEGGISIEKSTYKELTPGKDLPVSDISYDGKSPFVSCRVGLTNSRENLSEQMTNFLNNSPVRASESPEKCNLFSEGEVLYTARGGNGEREPREKLKMRQYLEPAVQCNTKSLDASLINTVNLSTLNLSRVSNEIDSNISNFPADLNVSETVCKHLPSTVGIEVNLSNTQGRTKGRKRWGLNMAVKSGSLKSNKSDKSDGGSKSGDSSRHSSGRGMGAMMLANLQGNNGQIGQIS